MTVHRETEGRDATGTDGCLMAVLVALAAITLVVMVVAQVVMAV